MYILKAFIAKYIVYIAIIFIMNDISILNKLKTIIPFIAKSIINPPNLLL
ncbi:hypothetical protein C672_0679 [[Clostridium] bifermentans ATCC 638]|uniref:Uncharacterized protein n=1 Tax=Paraclostridium bifermentans ATCC 638 = DSM 14991 TaxID=1233171 RepID=T4VTR7_PARBF|nr:hypothetical protein C672_0679 [[Clostridium] bifermentans ATCC 638] [Paraclostridium bifermentans ATCC 638 = DSM 14991]